MLLGEKKSVSGYRKVRISSSTIAPYEMNGRIFPSLSREKNLSQFPDLRKSAICETEYIRREQSSPGNLQVGQVPSNWTRQIPHTSSSGMSQRQEATAFHSLMVTFILLEEIDRGSWWWKVRSSIRSGVGF